MTLLIRRKLENFFDKIVEKILAIEDYLCLPQNVHASEITLFGIAALWAVWLMAFDVERSSPVYAYMYSEKVWLSVFAFTAWLHVCGVWFGSMIMRQLAAQGYAIIWFIWLVIVSYAQITSTAAPTIFIILCLSVYVAVRLSRQPDETEAQEEANSPSKAAQ